MVETVLPVGTSYEDVYARFRWQIPATFNIGVDVCDRHASDPTRLAMIYEDEAGHVSAHTFAEFRARYCGKDGRPSNRRLPTDD